MQEGKADDLNPRALYVFHPLQNREKDKEKDDEKLNLFI